jgi:hypothetical protein
MDPEETPARAREDLVAWRREADENAFDSDPFFRRTLERLAPEVPPEELRRAAELAGPDTDALVTESSRDENLPRVRRHDAFGRPTEDIVFHPAYHEVGRRFWASGVLSLFAEPGRNVHAGALLYLLDRNGEAGHACPVACTAGAIQLLRRLGTEAQKRRYLPRLLERDYDRALRAGQLVTEIQGGSDAGTNACLAEPEPGAEGVFRLRGEKWFCSVADAGLYVVSARVPGRPEGTDGLGLFLLPREIDGRPNGIRVRRLKWKLGTRSMATGEFELEGARAEAVGPLEDGFRNLVSIVLDTSRVHNALAASAIARRAFVEALAFARHRRAFGRPIAEFPAVQEILARMRLRAAAALATTFSILAATDRLETSGPDPTLLSARRIAVMANKYWTAVAATASVRDGIEVLGGNGTIEDFSVLPRLYRDAIVLESWEGTHNTLIAQIHRDFATRGLHRPWLEVVAEEVARLRHPDLAPFAERARRLHAEVAERIERLLAADPPRASLAARRVVEAMCRLAEWTALSLQAQWERSRNLDTDTRALLELYAALHLEGRAPEEFPGGLELQRDVALRR